MKITIDSANVNIENGKVTLDLTETQLNSLLNYGKVELSTLNPGDEFKIGDEVFIVLEQGESGTKVIAKEFAYTGVTFGDCNDWRKSPIRTTLNNDYYNKLAAIIGKHNIIPMERDLTSLDGLDDYGTVTDNISLFTAAEYAKFHKILGVNITYPDWWWLITALSTPSNGYARGVCYVGSNGVLSWNGCRYSGGVRPFLTLKSSLLVTLNKA